ncbi:MFS transporter [Sphaerisporangium melleum]|uniref:MFS transporter n=1 Tax=Sphaerisporangium melleum TaxID=321316 RepID=A0A917R411_9ACTN|nr:MFS transporter [Sphaerisporangium melleum]GGK87765.1 MFS transporter [Sphaerisporangium melleum]GII72440.1 MFS transporter [Sphaerisporangium melleum]
MAGVEAPATRPSGPEGTALPRSTILVLAVACGLCVANLYYIQPIMQEMAAALRTTPDTLTRAVSCTQLGYAVGLVALVPLGDATDRRRLLSVLMASTTAVLAVIPFASGAVLLCLCFLLGLVTVSAMVILPQAANMALPEQRGRVVGTVMTGLILGALLCRTFAGLLADVAGWRAVFWSAAGLMLAVGLAVRRVLVPTASAGPISPRAYLRLLASLAALVRHSPVLVERTLYGACGMAAFSILWTALPLRLGQPPYEFGPAAIGLMGLLGAAGALGASLAGRLADGGRQTMVTATAFTAILLSFAVASAHGASIAVLSGAVLLVDFSVQAAHITNQATIFADADGGTRSRVNTVYMTAYFLGGSLGSAAAGAAWPYGGWSTVAPLGVGVAGLALLLLLGHRVLRRRRDSPTTPEGKH